MNFSFLNNVVLWILPLSLFPLILHLFLRRPPKSIYFSDLRFLKDIYKKSRPRKRIKEWLILILRMLSILFLLFYFSRPVLNWGGNVGKEDSAALVVLLDFSYSMQYQMSGISLWTRAVQLAKTAYASLKKSDRSALILFSDEINFSSGYLSNQHSEWSAQLESFRPSCRQTNFLIPLQKAYQLLSDSGASNKSILILSDMAEHGWFLQNNSKEQWQSLIKDYDPAVRILYSDFQKHENNVSLKKLQVTPDFYSGMLKFQVQVKNWGDQTVSGIPVFVDFQNQDKNDGNQRQSETHVSLNPFEEKAVSLSAPLPEDFITGFVGMRSDQLPIDDQLYFARPVPKKIKILCIEEHSGLSALTGESYCLRQALTAPPSQFDVTTVTLDEVKRTDLKKYQTVILVNPSELEISAVGKIKDYLKNGGSLFLTLGNRSLENQMQSIAELLPCSVQYLRETPDSIVRFIKADDEELEKFSAEYDLQKIKVDKTVQSVVQEDAEVWMTLQDGTPILVISKEGRIAVWTSTIDRSWNNLVSKPIFVPLMRFIVRKISSGQILSDWSDLTVGESVKKKITGFTNEKDLSLISADGEKIGLRFQNKEWISEPVENAGICKLTLFSDEKKAIEQFAVNLKSEGEESFLRKISAGNLEKILSETKWIPLRSGDQYQSDLIAALRGKELSRALLAFAAFFLMSELILTRKKK